MTVQHTKGASRAVERSPLRPSPSSKTRPSAPSSVSIHDVRAFKKPRLSASQETEKRVQTSRKLSQDGPMASLVLLPHDGSAKGKSTLRSGRSPPRDLLLKDEQALMDDLMSGLDASVFDNFEVSSPAKAMSQRSQKSSTANLTKRKSHPSPHSSQFSPSKRQAVAKNSSRSPLQELKSHPVVVSRFSKWLINEQRHEQDVKVEEIKEEIKPFDDQEFNLDFDLGDFFSLDEDLVSVEDAMVKYPILHPPVPPAPPGYIPTPWIRCKVQAVYDGLRTLEDVLNGSEALYAGPSHVNVKSIVVRQKDHDVVRLLHLKERWAELPIQAGDIVNIISPHLDTHSTTTPLRVSFKDPDTYLIHHPDIMLTMTSIANAMPCPRRPILQSMVRQSGPASKSMLYGTILHGLLQRALSEQTFDLDSTRLRLDEDLSKEDRKLEMWGAKLGFEDVKLEVGEKARIGFETFGRKWIGSTPMPGGELHASDGEKPSLLAINGLHDIEEDIWSPKWGLKGKVDASVQAKISTGPAVTDFEEHVAPLEIKTGRSVGIMAHRAQTMLYTLLMEDRYNVPVPAGLLYYSQLDSVLRVEAKQNEMRALILARNELAGYLVKQRQLQVTSDSQLSYDIEDSSFLPPTIDNPRECKTCYASDSCMLYRKAEQMGSTDDADPLADLFEEKTGHLSEKDMEFFRKWETLLTIEEQDIGRFRSQLWTMTAKERRKTGRCFSDMVISAYSNDLGQSLAKIHRHSYIFTRSSRDGHDSLLSGHIARGDPVSLSIEPDLLCLSRGFVTELTPSSITIAVTYPIDTDALLARTNAKTTHMTEEGKVVFRIDKDEMASGVMRMRGNLAELFFAGGAQRLRQLVVDLDPPVFEPARLPRPEEIPSELNADQANAMAKVLSAKDYALILGMPGTGKTTLIAEIIKALVERGKTVLLTSYTHSAVDTILMKLLNAEFGIFRLGNIDKVHPDVQHLTMEAMEPSTSEPQFEARLMGPPVVAATCLAVDHPLFFRRRFDFCIVDEASQITLPTCLGPLRLADAFVLVGDHFQLPPIVKNHEARKGGLDVSLFKLLSEAHPSAVTDLSYQFRMNEDIMLLSNRLIYEGRLKCGSEMVAKQSLNLPQSKPCQEIFNHASCEACWIQDLLSPTVKAVFVDTDQLPGYDSKIGSLVQNETEATLVQHLAQALTSCGVKQNTIAIITPYRQQIKLFTGLFVGLPKVEILTADKSQGRDKDCILISLVRSNEHGNIGDLLKDWRRINVSFTRAKRKLVIFGSRRTLSSDPLLKTFLDLMNEQGWIYTLPKGAMELHSTQQVLNAEHEKRSATPHLPRKGRVGEMVLEKPFLRDMLSEMR